jgi:hypothetical protein
VRAKTTTKQAVGYVRESRVGGRGGDSFLSPDLHREQIDAAARHEGRSPKRCPMKATPFGYVSGKGTTRL